MDQFKYLYFILLSNNVTMYVSTNNRKHLNILIKEQFAVIKRTINGVF